MDEAGSVTAWARQLGDQDPAARDEAARNIWDHYGPRLVALVRQHLARRIRRREDEDDVLQSMYKSFCQNQREGKYQFKDRHDVWGMLLRITLRKVSSAAERHRAGCRDVGREQAGPSGAAEDCLGPQWLLEHLAGPGPGPAEVAEVNDEVERLLRLLPEDLRRVVLWRLEGYSNREIAGMIGRTERSVEIKLQRVRRRWEAS
jgi:DNA-directed RNA polymerase specialized sigma24 family protein